MNNAEPGTTQQLAQIMESNRCMLKLAEQGDWEKVMEEEQVRRDLIERFYSNTDQARKVPGIAEMTREMISINKKLTKLAVHAKKQMGGDASSIGKGRRAVNAYSSNAG